MAKHILFALWWTVGTIFLAETLVVFLLGRWPRSSPWTEALVSAALLSAIALPAVYFFGLRPLAGHVARHGRDERALAEAGSYLSRAEATYRDIFENALHGIYQSTPDGTLITANPAMARLLGYASAQELLEMTGTVGQIYADPGGRAEFLQLLARDGVVHGLEFEVLRRDGGRRWASEDARVVRHADGAVRYFEGTLTDITDRVRAQHALRDSEVLLKETQAIAGLGSYVLDVRTGRWSSSDVLDGIFGIDVGFDRTVDGWTSLVHPDWQDLTAHYFKDEVLDQRGRFDLEYQIIRKSDGQQRWVHGLGQLEFDRQDHPVRMIGTIADITQRKRADTALRLRGEALNAAAHAIVITDHHGTIEWVNSALTAATGYEAYEVIGKNPRDLFKSGVHDQAFYTSLWDTVLAGGVWRGEMVNRRKNGSLYTEDMAITPIRNDRGSISHFVAVKQDITERKKLELQFLRTQRLESIGLLAGGIAHDLNNVLAPILMSVDLLKPEADDDSRALLDTIAASAHRGADMVKQVLSFARGLEGRRVDVQMRHLVHEIEKIANKTFPKGIRVRATANWDLWTVLGDPTELHQVLLNLCINARDAMPTGGMLSVTADNVTLDEQDAAVIIDATAGRYVVIQVDDTGTGIPSSIIDQIFDPFFTTKTTDNGTGLGLSTSLTIVRSHGGFVRVSSELGAGTRFRIWLPARPASHKVGGAAAVMDLPRGNGETVMVVDDEAAIREITRQTLEAFGYRVLMAANGAEAVALYSQHSHNIAVVITDLMMPVMDGAAAIQVLIKMNPAVRIIAVSGHDSSSGALPKTEAGAIPFLPKPYSPETLLQTLRQVLANERQGNLNLFG